MIILQMLNIFFLNLHTNWLISFEKFCKLELLGASDRWLRDQQGLLWKTLLGRERKTPLGRELRVVSRGSIYVK